MAERLLQVHGIANCDTVKRARAWLEEQAVRYQWHDFKKTGVSAEALGAWLEKLGPDKVVNRKGTTWRSWSAQMQLEAASVEGAKALLSAHTGAIKRPLVEWPDGAVTVGFDPDLWASRLQR